MRHPLRNDSVPLPKAWYRLMWALKVVKKGVKLSANSFANRINSSFTIFRCLGRLRGIDCPAPSKAVWWCRAKNLQDRDNHLNHHRLMRWIETTHPETRSCGLKGHYRSQIWWINSRWHPQKPKWKICVLNIFTKTVSLTFTVRIMNCAIRTLGAPVFVIASVVMWLYLYLFPFKVSWKVVRVEWYNA